MCALFGWFKPEFAHSVDKERLFRHLARKSQMYGEKSFGLAGRKLAAGSPLEVVRYTGSASSWLEQNAKELKKYAALDVLIGHCRLPTHGAVTKLNAHPFPIGNWLTAHNGMIRNAEALMSRAAFVSRGDTDSEAALCYIVSEDFSPESLKKIEGSFAFEAISRDGKKGLLVCDGRQNLHVAKVGAGYVWCTDGEALESSLKAAGVNGAVVERIRSKILNLATGDITELDQRSACRSDLMADEETRLPLALSATEQLEHILHLETHRPRNKTLWNEPLNGLNTDLPPELS